MVVEIGMRIFEDIKVRLSSGGRCSSSALPTTNYQLPTTNYQLPSKSAFTLLEVLVASVLMGMLVTILTMIFNQSAIAWRTGKAGVADLSESERKMSRIHSLADNVLPYTGGDNYSVVSPWDDAATDSSRVFNHRGIRKSATLRTGVSSIGGNYCNNDAGRRNWLQDRLGRPDMNGGRAFVVGVRSAGPDREWDTEDDISTWPDEVD